MGDVHPQTSGFTDVQMTTDRTAIRSEHSG